MRVPGKVCLLVAMAVGGLAGTLLPGCASRSDPWQDLPGAKRVVASFPPLYCFAKNIAGNDAAVKPLLTTQGVHGYQATAKDALLLKRADLFLINGLELDNSFATKLKNNSGNPNLKLVAVGEEAIPEERLIHLEEHAHHGHAHAHHGHSHGEHDPHVWLGIPEAIDLVNRTRDELVALDPEHAAGYQSRTAAYVERLKALQEEGKKALGSQSGGKPRIVSLHESLNYFARSFDLEIVDSIQPQPGIDPSPREIADLVAKCRAKGVRVIAVEPQYQQNTAATTLLEALKKEGVAAVHVVVDPLETADPNDDLDSPDWYERKMRENISNLANALR